MIRLRDATILAYTKLRTRKIRTGITVAISGILFGLLFAFVLVVAGVEKSVDDFGNEGLGKRFIASVFPGNGSGEEFIDFSRDKVVIKRAEEIQKTRIEDKKLEAKKLGIIYDPAQEKDVTEIIDKEKYLSLDTPAAKAAIKEYYAAHPQEDRQTIIKKALSQYNPKTYFKSSSAKPDDGKLATMKQGKEKLTIETTPQKNITSFEEFQDQGDQLENGLQFMDGSLTAPFLLKKMSWKPESKAIPVMITYRDAEKLLKLPKLPVSASSEQKLQRIAKIRDQAGMLTIQGCYRNSSSQQLIESTIFAEKEMQKNKSKKDYEKPKLIYELPAAESCGPATIKTDTRSSEEKKTTANQLIFDKKFNNATDPAQSKITFQVVGVSPGFSVGEYGFIGDIVSIILSSSLGGSWVIPQNMYDQLPSEQQYKPILIPDKNKNEPSALSYGPFGATEQYYVEFANFDTAKSALKKLGCGFSGCSPSSVNLQQFGSGSIAVQEFKESARSAFLVVVAVIVGVAMLIMAGTIGRMIADGRRETAVFRAIGAKRLDISLIYSVYTVLLSLDVAIFGALLGGALAYILDYYQSPGATVGAQLAFGSSDLTREFHIVGLNGPELLFIVAVIFATGLISMILPLLRNIRRNPIRDMRDE